MLRARHAFDSTYLPSRLRILPLKHRCGRDESRPRLILRWEMTFLQEAESAIMVRA